MPMGMRQGGRSRRLFLFGDYPLVTSTPSCAILYQNCGVVSLLEMLQLYADMFLRQFAKVNKVETMCATVAAIRPGEIVPAERCAELYASIGVFGGLCGRHGLASPASKCTRISRALENRNMQVSYAEVNHWLIDLRERFEDDLGAEIFLHLSADEAKYYSKPDEEWTTAISRFPKIRHDVEECSKCFALQRYAASLFHALLVAEFGVIKVAELFGVSGDKPGWGALDRLQKINEKKWKAKTSVEQKHAEFLKNLLPLAIAIKDSWRHKISHVDNKLEWMDTDFSPKVSGEIISATRGFMRRLAEGLPK